MTNTNPDTDTGLAQYSSGHGDRHNLGVICSGTPDNIKGFHEDLQTLSIFHNVRIIYVRETGSMLRISTRYDGLDQYRHKGGQGKKRRRP